MNLYIFTAFFYATISCEIFDNKQNDEFEYVSNSLN